METNKKYWKGIEELDATPDFLSSRDNEFPQELPVEDFLGNESLKEASTGRRDFLKFLGFSVAAATLAACETPVIKSIPYVNKPEDINPGIANWYASTYYDGNDYASILVKTREGRPIYIKGNKQHGINGASVNSRINTSVIDLYNQARLQNASKDGEAIKWSEADAYVVKALKEAVAKGGNIRLLTTTVISPSTQAVLNKFKETYTVADEEGKAASVEVVTYDAVSASAIRQANKESFGQAIVPDYKFEKAQTIVSVGADFMSNWLLSTEYMKQYLVNRLPENKWMSRHYQFETNMSITGSSADIRAQIKPSEEGKVIAALYEKVTGQSSGIKTSELAENLMAKVADAAKELKARKGEALVVAGSNNKGIQVLVNGINNALNSYSNTIDLSNPVNIKQGNDAEVQGLIKEMKTGKVDVLFILGNVNPVYSLANGASFAEGLSKVKTSVSFSKYADETTSLVNFSTPDHHALESWNDLQVKANHVAIVQPTIRPLFDTRSAQESLLVWAGQENRSADKESQVYYDFIRKNWEATIFTKQSEKVLFTDFWNWAVHNGSATVSTEAIELTPFAGNISAAAKSINKIKTGAGEFELNIYQKVAIGDGIFNQAANPFLQELPDPISKVTWDNYITMSIADVKRLGFNTYIGQDNPASVASITVNGVTVKLPVYPSPGQAIGTLGVALGYGRAQNGENIGSAAFHTGKYGDHVEGPNGGKLSIGANAYTLTSTDAEGNVQFNATQVEFTADIGENYPLACTQTQHTVMGRESVVKETPLSFYKTGQKEFDKLTGVNGFNESHLLAVHEDGKAIEKNINDVDLWDAHPVENVGHRWGMTIDLNTCIGCSACVSACHIENNVPVVGKDEVRRSRDMHWLRIDRYYSSEATRKEGYDAMEVPSDSPEVVHMPMMCQHCNHAPCETVCPVAATSHSNEGLNQMTYNRCIGTRYCANNCPYKVRRFNWFNYQAYRKFKHTNVVQDDLGRMVLNPDVTVRARGVMEKCSMCVQRIQAGKLEAKMNNETVKDGAIETACSESCPTNAISFGDYNDTNSTVAKGSKSDRAYRTLEEVGVQPNMYYKVKVRNDIKNA